MRILLVGNYQPDLQQSMQRYAAWLAHALSKRGYQVSLAVPQPFFSRLTRHHGLKKYLGYIDKFLLFPPRLRRLAKSFDLVHVLDHSNSMYLRTVRKTPSLITCHDVLAIRAARGEFPVSPVGRTGKLLQRWILSGLRSSHHVLCVSAKTASDLKTLTGETGTQVRVIYSPLNWSYQPSTVLPDDLVGRLGLQSGQPFLLHVGGNQWYKNRMGVLRIYARLVAQKSFSTYRLVMAGKPWTAAMRKLVRDEQLGDRVIESVGCSNEELQALYSHAQALLFPSLEEGFGWPLLEAQACGCPVITTGRPPMTEVAGQAAIYIDPDNPEAAANLIADGLQHREQLRAAGFHNLERFAEDVVIAQYSAFYAEILKNEHLATSRR
jgi:glycosyltransferase involved in cell wall biosynthesis